MSPSRSEPNLLDNGDRERAWRKGQRTGFAIDSRYPRNSLDADPKTPTRGVVGPD